MAITVFQNLTQSTRAILKGWLAFCALGQANEIFTHPATTQAVALLKPSLNRNPALGVPGSGVSALNLFRWAAGRFRGELLLSGATRDRNLKMGASFCSLTQKPQSRNDFDLGFQGFDSSQGGNPPKALATGRCSELPSLSEALTLLENCLSWPPPTRRAAISLWCAEAGMHPTEVWDVARAWLGEVSL